MGYVVRALDDKQYGFIKPNRSGWPDQNQLFFPYWRYQPTLAFPWPVVGLPVAFRVTYNESNERNNLFVAKVIFTDAITPGLRSPLNLWYIHREYRTFFGRDRPIPRQRPVVLDLHAETPSGRGAA